MNQEYYNYKEALKLGQKEYRARNSKNENPYLPALNDIIPSEKILNTVNMGEVQIPLTNIVGTKTPGRMNAFAANFMPLLDESSEFAHKWESLYHSHLREGIRDCIKVYEYMNRFYIEEGNKRVSVLKYCNAYNVRAEVLRILPEKTDDEDVQLYYEFVEFNKITNVNFIEFSKRGSYHELLQAMGKSVDEVWSLDEQRSFSGAFYFFEQAYLKSGGDKLKTTVGDAMLSYIQVYGYSNLQHSGEAQIRINLRKMWEEVALKEQDDKIQLKTTPSQEKKPSVIERVFNLKPSTIKAAFIYDMPPEKSGWVNEHEEGRKHVQTVLGDRVQTTSLLAEDESKLADVLEEAIRQGNTLIFTVSPRMMKASLRTAVEHPDVVIMNCSLNSSHRYVRTYYPRMYEVKFILGAIAGSLTQSGRLGYVCDYPIFGQIAGINAFALGAQMANPRAKVFLEWSSVKGAKEAAVSLNCENIHLISSHDTARYREDDRLSFGLSHVENDKADLLAVPVRKWGVYYERILRSMLDSTIKDEYFSSNRALNYYWGMSAGVVDIEFAPDLPMSSRRFAEYFRNCLIHGVGSPFFTPFYTQGGKVIGNNQYELSLEQIINMDYLVDNVIGRIPSYDELTPIGKSTVDMMGVLSAKADAEKKEGVK